MNVGIPEVIRSEFREAATCLDAGCYKAAMTMGRRVLQRVLKDKGCAERNLVDQIKEAEAKDILRACFKGLATEIRQYGNLGAHPDDDQLANCNKDHADLLLQFLKMIIHELYEIPAQAAVLKSRRTSPVTP